MRARDENINRGDRENREMGVENINRGDRENREMGVISPDLPTYTVN